MIEKLGRNEKIIDDNGHLTTRAYIFFSLLADNSPFRGQGTPEGNVEAKINSLYIDENGGSGNVLYVKRDADVSGDRSKGWILV